MLWRAEVWAPLLKTSINVISWASWNMKWSSTSRIKNTPSEHIGRINYALGLCCSQLMLVEDHFIFYSLHINRILELGRTNLCMVLITGVWDQNTLSINFFFFILISNVKEKICAKQYQTKEKNKIVMLFPFHDRKSLLSVLACQWLPTHLTSNCSSL